tara:strand:+ start:504 stop:893 length:390 start_codon:yes stop_codon:yes gene_type:complete
VAVYKTDIESQVASSVVSMSQSFPSGGAALAVQAVTASATDVFAVVIDNSLNTAVSYLKCWDTTGSITIGTDNPNMVLKADAGVKVQYSFDAGVPFGSGIKAAVLTSKGTAGTTAPSNDVNITFLATPS